MTLAERKMMILKYREKYLSGTCVILIPYKPEYVEEVIGLRNNDRSKYYLNQNYNLSIESQNEWYKSYLQRNNDIYWCIFNKSGEFIGTTRVYDIDLEGKVCEKGSLIIKEDIALGKPYALESEIILIKFIFNELSISSIFTTNRFDNLKMQSMNERLGFVKTGTCLIRDVEYFEYKLDFENFNPEPFDQIIEHWKKRDLI